MSGLRSTRMLGSSSTSRVRAELSLSRSALDAGSTATGNVGGGKVRPGRRRGVSRVDRLSPVTVWTSFATAPISPATSSPTGSWSLPLMRSTWPIRSSSPRPLFQTWSCDLIVPDHTRK